MALNLSALRVEWNPANKKEVQEAKNIYLRARKESRKILSIDGKPVEHFTAHLDGFIVAEIDKSPDTLSIRIFDATGDRRLIWDNNDPLQIREAATLFKEYLGKGWRAYAVDSKGESTRRVYHFDADLMEVYFDETKTTKDILKDFCASFGINLQPKTFPG